MQPLVAAPAIGALLYRAYSKKSLTPLALFAAGVTATVHALHQWSVFFALLGVFFLSGTSVTKVKHEVKARRTLSSTGSSGAEGARTHIQVLANSLPASILIFLHYWYYPKYTCFVPDTSGPSLLVAGIVSNYAATAADTFASELGILATSPPRLITSFTFRSVPPGTNGGVTFVGLLASFLGASIIALTTLILTPFCTTPDLWNFSKLFLGITFWGGLGSILDSFLGGWLQATVVDRRTGKVIEGLGGRSVPYETALEPGATMSEQDRRLWKDKDSSRYRVAGSEWLDNNGVNLLMATLMSLGGMVAAHWWWS